MDNDCELVRQGVERYCHAIHTQERSDFCPLWAEGIEPTLITPDSGYVGTENIYHDFLLKRIRQTYSTINLNIENLQLQHAEPDSFFVLFNYHAKGICRDNGSEFDFAGHETQVWIRQRSEWRLLHIHYTME